MSRYFRFFLFLALCFTICWLARDLLSDLFVPKSPREKYARQLRRNLGEDNATYKNWLTANDQALHDQATMTLPQSLAIGLRPKQNSAVGLRFSLQRGRGFEAAFSPTNGRKVVFGELYQVGQDGQGEYFDFLTAWDTSQNQFRFLAAASGEYVLLLQSGIYQSVLGQLIVRDYAPLAFPVADVGNEAAKSFWGAPRDGGRRKHEGVDIFAPKGTDLLAVSDGEITRVKEGGLGGKVVWMWDAENDLSIYYAHLDQQLVREGERVRTGDVIGTVGNTGNARTTPPHLHFGIYPGGQGAVDPWPFIKKGTFPPQANQPNASLLGKKCNLTGRNSTALTSQPQREGTVTIATVEGISDFYVIGLVGQYALVRTAEGKAGYLPARLLKPN